MSGHRVDGVQKGQHTGPGHAELGRSAAGQRVAGMRATLIRPRLPTPTPASVRKAVTRGPRPWWPLYIGACLLPAALLTALALRRAAR